MFHIEFQDNYGSRAFLIHNFDISIFLVSMWILLALTVDVERYSPLEVQVIACPKHSTGH